MTLAPRVLLRCLASIAVVAGCGDSTSSTESGSGTTGGTTVPGTTGTTGTTGTGTTSDTTADDPTTGTTTDDPTTGTTAATTSSGTTGTTTGDPVECGNGVVEAGEECDDGNVVYMVEFGRGSANSLDCVF